MVLGLPTSWSHALFGGMLVAIAKAGFGAVIASGWTKTLLFIVLAPMIGMGVGLVVMNSIQLFLREDASEPCRSVVPPPPARLSSRVQLDARRK